MSSVRSQLRSQLRESVKVAILEAAEDLIAANGLAGAPLAQIAKKAGVAVGTLYNYFEDRDALIRGLFEMRRATLHPELRAAVKKGAALPFEQRLRSFVRDVLGVFEAHRKYVKVALETEHLKLSHPSTTKTDLTNAIAELVKAGIKEKLIAAEYGEVLPVVLQGAVKAVLMYRLGENAPITDADADKLVSILLDGARR
ncbi:MAG TPA: TetR/AcrR family transcriptional regulator [Kofleriaceae bacterium]|nr:TetR/AcrR family transcriptional regulator [Kofleriaceae bacterium]